MAWPRPSANTIPHARYVCLPVLERRERGIRRDVLAPGFGGRGHEDKLPLANTTEADLCGRQASLIRLDRPIASNRAIGKLDAEADLHTRNRLVVMGDTRINRHLSTQRHII